MKKILLPILMLMFTISLSAQNFLSNSDVSETFRTKTITVKNGGQSPDVVTLLQAFHQALPTWVVGEVMKQYKNPMPGTKRNGSALFYEDHNDDDFYITIDPKNGYVCFSSQTDVDQMTACVWRRTNGHRVFAISLYEQHDKVQNLLCWFDYDPATQTMKAERSPMDNYKNKFQTIAVSWALPQKGTDFEITEYYTYKLFKVHRIYKWDGMKHVYSRTTISDFKYKLFAEGDPLQASKQGFTHYALVDFENGGYPVLCLKKDNSNGGAPNVLVVAPFKNDIISVAINDECDVIEGFSKPKPQSGEPWTGEEVVAFTRDMEGVNYFVVLKENAVSYLVTDTPDIDENGNRSGFTKNLMGYGSKNESENILHADVAKHITFDPKWEKFEFISEDDM